MPRKRPSQIANLGDYNNSSQKRRKLTSTSKENIIPFPGSYPTSPPLSYTTISPLQPHSTILNVPEPCPVPRVTEDDEFEDDDEINENGQAPPWTHTTALAGQFIPPPTVEEATLALADLKLILQPPRNSGGGHKDPKLDLLL
ncbi:hypothetical protein M405DRAFT_869254 [Rhizopogon salebrosus TDB-379]|nr:hypothetical protein M405DRAFT_869254 [Rhizopogon salebrosus TDB-379]